MGLFGGGDTKQTVTQKTEPWREAKPYFLDLYKKGTASLR